jgi:S-adenosylmethionine:diacylglycerol 3-amino-3-carboxypropyl transferase
MKITEKEFEDLLIKNAVDCDANRDWIDSDFATVFKVVESLVEKASSIHNVSMIDNKYPRCKSCTKSLSQLELEQSKCTYCGRSC